MGFAVSVLGAITGIIGLGIVAAGIYYTATDWGSEDGGEKARVYALLIAGIIIMALSIAGLCYFLFKPSGQAASKGMKLKK